MANSVEEDLARIEVAITLNRFDKLEKIVEAQKKYIESLEETNKKLREALRRTNPYFLP